MESLISLRLSKSCFDVLKGSPFSLGGSRLGRSGGSIYAHDPLSVVVLFEQVRP